MNKATFNVTEDMFPSSLKESSIIIWSWWDTILEKEDKIWMVDFKKIWFYILWHRIANIQIAYQSEGAQWYWEVTDYRWLLFDLDNFKEFDWRIRNTSNDYIHSILGKHIKTVPLLSVYFTKDKYESYSDIDFQNDNDYYDDKVCLINTNTFEKIITYDNRYLTGINEEVYLSKEKYLSITDSDGYEYLVDPIDFKPLKIKWTNEIISSISHSSKKYRFWVEYIEVYILYTSDSFYINSLTFEKMPFYLQII